MNERTQEMIRAYVEGGLTYEQIAAEHGLTRQRVGQILGPLDLDSVVKRRMLEREQTLRAAHARITTGETSLKKEAERLGYSHGESLRAAFRRLGLRALRSTPEHGTFARYTSRKWRCRCADCRRANAQQMASYKGQEPPTHGASGYGNYGCRCQVCTEAHRVTSRARRAAKRQRGEVNA